MRRKVSWLAGTVGLLAFSFAAPALAADPPTLNTIQLGIGFRYGIEMNDGDFNPWGVGLGVDGGITLPNAVYVGGNAEYFFGQTEEAAGVKESGNIWQIMAEGGYDFGFGPFVLRPKLGAGLARSGVELCLPGYGCAKDSSADFALAPGAKFMIMAPMLTVAVDARYEFVFADETGKALILSAGVGF